VAKHNIAAAEAELQEEKGLAMPIIFDIIFTIFSIFQVASK